MEEVNAAAARRQPAVPGPNWFVKLVRTILNGNESPVEVQTVVYTVAVAVWSTAFAPFHVTMTWYTLGMQLALENLGICILIAILLWLLTRRTISVAQGQTCLAGFVTLSSFVYISQANFRTIHLSGMEIYSIVTYLLNLDTFPTMMLLGLQKTAVIVAAVFNAYHTAQPNLDTNDLITLVGLSVSALAVYFPACRSRTFVLKNYRKEYKSALGHKDVAALQQFLFHELRNPLVTIVAALNEFVSATKMDDNGKALPMAVCPLLPYCGSDVPLAEEAQQSAEQLERLLFSMQEVLRLRAGDVEMLHTVSDIRSTLQVALQMAEADERTMTVAWESPEARTVSVATDHVALTQILRNLILNAVSYRSHVAKVTIRKYTPTARWRCCSRLRPKDEWVEIGVENDGPGIPEAELSQIFDMFALRTHRRLGGSGLGLVETKLLCDAINAELQLESRPGHTIASVRLPVAPQPVDPTRQDQACPNTRDVELVGVDGDEHGRLLDGSQQFDAVAGAGEAVTFAGRGLAIVKDSMAPEEQDFVAVRGIRGPAEALRNLRRVAFVSQNEDARQEYNTNAAHRAQSRQQGDDSDEEQQHGLPSLTDFPNPPNVFPHHYLRRRPRLPGFRVLFVDDVPGNRLVGKRLLQQSPPGVHGRLKVDEAANGEEAVQMYRRALDENDVYSVVYMDITMPVMDGWAATEEIRKIEKSRNVSPATIVAVTGNTMPDDVERSLRCGMDDVYFKPYQASQFYAPLQALMMPR